jgi:hypothetical protein
MEVGQLFQGMLITKISGDVLTGIDAEGKLKRIKETEDGGWAEIQKISRGAL